MRNLWIVLLVWWWVTAGLCSPLGHAATLKEARNQWLRGRYDKAQEQYRQLLRMAKQQPQAAVGLSRALQSQGEYDKALEVVESTLKDHPRDAGLLARQAEVLYLRGRWKEAEKAADAALAANKEDFLAHWVRVQLYRDRGDVKKSINECLWFIRMYVRRDNNDDPIKDPDQLLLVGLAGLVYARYYSLSDQFRFVLNDVYADALKYDKQQNDGKAYFWLAEYESGALLLEKYNRGEALDSFDKALAINPNAAPALVGKGIAAIRKFEIKSAETFAERALKINPRYPAALRLRADVHLAVGDIKSALKELEQARKVNPRSERTLARMAACYHLQKRNDDFQKIVDEVAKFDSHPALFYYVLGKQLEDRRRFDRALAYFQKAISLRKRMPGPAGSLGLLYMRLGKEKEAEEQLNLGFKADPFNVRVSNMRKVLRHLQGYQTLKTKHFHLRYDPEQDAALARYMAQYLEQVYEDLATQFAYRPKGPILIELFNNHEMFSGRTIALPDLHTIGACTGRVVAMVSPNGRGVPKIFNWARVIRHELVHIFNLEQTHFLVPHWFTEGLAVRNENLPRPQTWNILLKERVPAGELMNLDNIQLGFIRPRGPLQWQLAYCQSELYVEYLIKEHGQEAVGKLLAAYADGLNTNAALQRVCKVDQPTFEKGYKAYLSEVVQSLGGKNETTRVRSLEELQEAYKKDTDDHETAAELALRLVDSDRVRARQLAERVLRKKKGHPRASVVLAKLARAGGDVREEKKLLEAALDEDKPDLLVLRNLGKIYYDDKEFAKAAKLYELGRKAEPYSNTWLKELIRVYAQSGNTTKLIEVLEAFVPTNADDFDTRSRLARLLLKEKQYARAERYARQALEINVRDRNVRNMLYQALEGQDKDDEARELRKLLE